MTSMPVVRIKYSPDQPRDHGRFAETEGGDADALTQQSSEHKPARQSSDPWARFSTPVSDLSALQEVTGRIESLGVRVHNAHSLTPGLALPGVVGVPMPVLESHLNVLNGIAESLELMKSDSPELYSSLTGEHKISVVLSPIGKPVYMRAVHDELGSMIVVNTQLDPTVEGNVNVTKGWSVSHDVFLNARGEGKSDFDASRAAARARFLHEVGHVVDYRSGRGLAEGIRVAVSLSRREGKMDEGLFREHLSRYALKNDREAAAEGFVRVFFGHALPSPFDLFTSSVKHRLGRKSLGAMLRKYSPDQPRDHGRFAEVEGDSGEGGSGGVASSNVGPHLTGRQLHAVHADKLASIAQSVYDSWDESNVDEFANGGICHLIAEEISSDLFAHGIENSTVSSNFEQHVYVVAKLEDGVYEVDVPHSLYERGGGFSWTKVPGVNFTREDVVVRRLDGDPESFTDYIDTNSLGAMLRKYRADQPRDHGRFAEVEGDEGAASSGRNSSRTPSGFSAEDDRALGITVVPVTADVRPELLGQLSGQEAGDYSRGLPDSQVSSARSLLKYIIKDYVTGPPEDFVNRVRRDADGNIMSGAQYRYWADDKQVELSMLASLEHGEGYRWMGEVEKFARDKGAVRISLESRKDAVSFYKHLGYTNRTAYPKFGLVPMEKLLPGRKAMNTALDETEDDVGALAMSQRVAVALLDNAGEFKEDVSKSLGAMLRKYSPDQPRDHGRFAESEGGDDGGGSSSIERVKPIAASLPITEDHFLKLLPGRVQTDSEIEMAHAKRLISKERALPATLKESVCRQLAGKMKNNADWQAVVAARDGISPMTIASLDSDPNRALASDFIQTWASSSSDTNALSLFMQQSVEQEFGLTGLVRPATLNSARVFAPGDELSRSALMQMGLTDKKFQTPEFIGKFEGAGKAFVRAMYERTQKDLKDNEIKTVTLARGVRRMKLEEGVQSVLLLPASSFTADLNDTFQFSGPWGRVVHARFPASRILSTSRTGLGCKNEYEYVVLGGKTEAMVVASNGDVRELMQEAFATRAPRRPKKFLKAYADEGFASPDATLEDADWAKLTWDLPPYKSEEFMRAAPDLITFRELPVYLHAVEAGLIINDEWVGGPEEAGEFKEDVSKSLGFLFRKYRDSQERDERGRWTSEGGGGAGESDSGSSGGLRSGPTAPSLPATEDHFTRLLPRAQYDALKRTAAAQEMLVATSLIRETPGDSKDLKAKVCEQFSASLMRNSKDWRAVVAHKAEQGSATSKAASLELSSDLIQTWAHTSSDSDPLSLFMQQSVEQEFDLAGTVRPAHLNAKVRMMATKDPYLGARAMTQLGLLDKGPPPDLNFGKAFERAGRDFVREMYNKTQKDLERHGIKTLTLARGVRVGLAEGAQNIVLHPASSFSSHEEVADSFRGNVGSVLFARFPASRILSTPRTGFGCRNEREYVVLGGKTEGVAVDAIYGDSRSGLLRAFRTQANAKKPKSLKAYADEGFASPDAALEDADWMKTTWDLPPYKSEEFMRAAPDLITFRELPVYLHAVEAGLIINDEWVGGPEEQ